MEGLGLLVRKLAATHRDGRAFCSSGDCIATPRRRTDTHTRYVHGEWLCHAVRQMIATELRTRCCKFRAKCRMLFGTRRTQSRLLVCAKPPLICERKAVHSCDNCAHSLCAAFRIRTRPNDAYGCLRILRGSSRLGASTE